MIDLTDKRFGRLIVISLVEHDKSSKHWLCQCDCGNRIIVAGGSLTRRKRPTQSCGCLKIDVLRSRKTHGHTTDGVISKTYTVWQHMLNRCKNPNAATFRYYGARGINVCQRWEIFENFLEDMGEKPHNKSIDRIDNDGNYEPGNCRWATRKEQARNKSNVRIITFNGMTMSLPDWADYIGIRSQTLRTRLIRWDDNIERALTTPLRGVDS